MIAAPPVAVQYPWGDVITDGRAVRMLPGEMDKKGGAGEIPPLKVEGCSLSVGR